MSENNYSFVGWEEHIICQERGNRAVHFYLKEASGILVLAVVGTERSIRHMMYVVSGEFVQAYGSHGFINANTKWRARREVVEWLQSLVSVNRPLSVSSCLHLCWLAHVYMHKPCISHSFMRNMGRQHSPCILDTLMHILMICKKSSISHSELIFRFLKIHYKLYTYEVFLIARFSCHIVVLPITLV